MRLKILPVKNFHILLGDNIYEIIFQILFSEVASAESFSKAVKVVSVANMLRSNQTSYKTLHKIALRAVNSLVNKHVNMLIGG